jgi:pyridoxal phosphate enzyme (YggS family)
MSTPSISELKSKYREIESEIEISAKKSGRSLEDIKIIAVSKTHPVDYIINGIEAGISYYGENYVQELMEKIEYFEKNKIKHPEWHYIGHLQRNKVKYIAPYVYMIHGVDSVRLANQIDKEAEKSGRIIDILLQVNTSGEDSKFGCEPDEVFVIAEHILNLKNVKLNGLMTIGSFTFDGIVNKKEFALLRELKERVNSKFRINLKELSMGMTNDYNLAVEEGATMVRIGTAIFGERDYSNKK